MKKIVIIILVIGAQYLIAQDNHNWLDTAPYANTELPVTVNRDVWDTVFVYTLPPPYPTKTAAETDGNYIYVTGWNTPEIFRYDMQGILLDTFMIDSIDDIRDLAYDGQYYYGASPTTISNIYVIDFDNEICIDTIQVPYACRSLAYNDDDSVFYSNNWDTDIIVFDHNGTIVDTLVRSSQTHLYASYYGLAYDNWSPGGPFLWAFSQEGANSGTLVQLELPSGHETGFYKDVGSLALGSIAGGLFTYPDYDSSRAVIGGVMQNELMFGFELGPANPPPTGCYSASFLHGTLHDSNDVQLSWTPAKYNLLNDHFNDISFPPVGWSRESEGYGWHNYVAYYINWEVIEWDSRYTATAEDYMMPDASVDYLISPYLEFINNYSYRLSFESYFDGTNNHSAYVKYSLDGGNTWELIHEMEPEPDGWTYQDLDLSTILSNPSEPVRIAFHADDNGGVGSGWAIDNVMVYSDDASVNVLGYDIYRDGIKINSELITGTTYIDDDVAGGTHDYYIKTIYSDCEATSGAISFVVPHYPPPPPSPDCNPPRNLEAEVLGNDDIELSWNSPLVSFSSKESWDVQFNVVLAIADGEVGAESDGSYIYTTNRKGPGLYKYDYTGSYIETIGFLGFNNVRNLAYVPSTGLTYLSLDNDHLDMFDLGDESFHGNLFLPGRARAIAYNEDLDVFYINYRSSDIMVVDRQTGDLVSSFICGSNRDYYDFAYDNWSEGGPYLWGFSRKGESSSVIVQISLPEGIETGFTYDASWLSISGNGLAGGLFAQENIVPGTITLCGVIKDELMFGLELGAAEWDFFVDGYNVFMDNTLLNAEPISDTTYIVPDPGTGTYSFEVSALYVDSVGDMLCESVHEGPLEVNLTDVFILGGNIIAGAYKLDAGEVNLYRFEGSLIEDQLTTTVDDFGYFFFPEMVPGYYMTHAKPTQYSNFFNSYLPTYSSGKLHWEDVTPEFIDGNSYTNDISLLEILGTAGGQGSISGNIHDLELEMPLADEQVMLLNTSNECLALSYSNGNGEFIFNDLELGTYKLLVEIVGKSMNPIIITLTEAEPGISGINLNVSAGEIVMGIDDGLPSWIDYISEVYPNPARDIASIKLHLKEPSDLDLKIYNVSGQVEQHEIFDLVPGLNKIELDIQDANNGVYFLNLGLGDRFTIVRKIIKH